MIHFKLIFVYDARYELSRATKNIRFYPTYKLIGYPSTVSVGAGKILKTPKTETKNFVTQSTANMSFMFVLVPFVP